MDNLVHRVNGLAVEVSLARGERRQSEWIADSKSMVVPVALERLDRTVACETEQKMDGAEVGRLSEPD
jgi:hypothetical protein